MEKQERQEDIRKVYIKNYGNLMLDIVSTNEIGISAISTRSEETLFIPWTSIIMVSKTEEQLKNFTKKVKQDEQGSD